MCDGGVDKEIVAGRAIARRGVGDLFMNPKKPPRVDALGFALALIGIAFLVFGVYRAVRTTVDALPLLIAGIAFCCAAVWQLSPR